MQVDPASDWSTVATAICNAHREKKMRDVAELEARRAKRAAGAKNKGRRLALELADLRRNAESLMRRHA
jgi:hypothetical protein